MVTALALQAQLSVIERKLDDLQTDVTSIIRDGQVALLAKSEALLTILADVHDDLTITGRLTEDDWRRVAGPELEVRTLHAQTSAQLRDMSRRLDESEARLSRRVAAATSATRNDRLRFWMEAHVVAEVALTRWELIRLHRLLATGDAKLDRETADVQDALIARRVVTEDLASHLADYVGRGGRVEVWLDRLRFVKRARLESLILQLDRALEAQRAWAPYGVARPAAALPGGTGDGFDWNALAEQVRHHAGTRPTGSARRPARWPSQRGSAQARPLPSCARS